MKFKEVTLYAAAYSVTSFLYRILIRTGYMSVIIFAVYILFEILYQSFSGEHTHKKAPFHQRRFRLMTKYPF